MTTFSKAITDLNNKRIQIDKIGNITESRDPYNINAALNTVPLIDSRVQKGIIIDSCPLTYSYKVLLVGCKAAIECAALQTGGGNGTLSYDSSFYAVGTSVLVSYSEKEKFGIILGALPIVAGKGSFAPKNKTSSFSRGDVMPTDKACLPSMTPSNEYVGIHEFGMGMPLDTTEIGEFGRETLTGVRLRVNPFMALMAVDDYTGLWEFDLDSLIRLSGINMQIRTSGREEDYFNDNGEYIEYKGSALYPWEQLGYLKKPTTDIIKESDKSEWIGDNAKKAYVEPAEDKAKPFHRVVDFGGWLGQGKQTQIACPPDEEWSKYGKKEKINGLHRLTQSIEGTLSTVSSNGIAINKRGVLPAVSRIERPDDTSTEIGDNKDNYTPNEFKAKPDIPTVSDTPNMERVMGLPDYLAYQQNFKELLPFLQHLKDYYVPEDKEINSGLNRNPQLGSLSSQHLIQSKSKKSVPLDDNSDTRKQQEVYAAESGIVDLPDGSKVIYGGNGEEIRMVGGSIFLEAPGDINIKAGRNVIIWAGNDLEMRAKNHGDISTTKGSFRIKAEKHLEMMGGNDEQGGVIIEGKGKRKEYDFKKPGEEIKTGGIILKSEKGIIASIADTLYNRCGVEGAGNGIYFDAGNGDSNIYTLCNSDISYQQSDRVINFANVKEGLVEETSIIRRTGTYLPGGLYVNGFTAINAALNCSGGIATADSLLENATRLRNDLEKSVDKPITERLPKDYNKIFESAIKKPIKEENKIGNDETVLGSCFTFRTMAQYKAPSDFAVYESRWQNIGNSIGVGNSWKENKVTAPLTEDTMPFPGKEYYTDIPCYVTQKWTLSDPQTGLFINRWNEDKPTDPYDNPKYGEQVKKVLNEYPVIK